ncbi:PREDICTED: protein kinase 4 isoform X1 [Drosophila arizonae]|uniref:Protein kinase 4 isoform X1 n=1 Tax=Drosophila arizonae TaxID=7263 RepID=A0ABM1NXX1_DROAR|nr:PREDICTED: protein kinase 4 isoform X1 [Drosophila arizonae]
MERNNGRYPYIRRQGSGNGPHNHHHHNNANSASAASPSSASTATNTSHSTQYSNNSINNATTNTNVLYATVSQQQQQQQQNVPISQHDELIRYIREAWNKVSEQGEIYCNESDNQLKNFKPFNLEEYWGQRLVQNIHVTTTHQ